MTWKGDNLNNPQIIPHRNAIQDLNGLMHVEALYFAAIKA